jgi:polyisoprenoid-binding protein YceI
LKIFIHLLLLLLFVTPVFASEVNITKSTFKWTATKVTGKHFGKLFLKSATAKLKENEITQAEFVINMNSFTVDDLSGEWETKFINHVKSDDFFSVKKYPEAKLVIHSSKDNIATASLTIKDKTNAVKIDFQQKNNHFTGTLSFDRTKFGIIYGSGSFLKNLGDKMIHDIVKIEFDVIIK